MTIKSDVIQIFSSQNVVQNRALNVLGLQIFRVLLARSLEILRRFPSARPETDSEYIRKLLSDGFVVIPDFLDKKAQGLVAEEYDRMMDTWDQHSVDGTGAVNIKIRGVDWAKLTPNVSRLLFNSDRISKIVHNTLGLRKPENGLNSLLRSRYQFFRCFSEDSAVGTSRNSEGNTSSVNWHADTFHNLYKAFYYVNDVKEANAPTLLLKQSHRISIWRLMLERASSIRRSNKSGSNFILKQEQDKLLSKKNNGLTSATATRGSLIIINTFCFHARGEFAPANSEKRDIVEVDFFNKPFL